MNFAHDTFQSIARRKKLAGWLLTLRGPVKVALGTADLEGYVAAWANMQAANDMSNFNAIYAHEMRQRLFAPFENVFGPIW